MRIFIGLLEIAGYFTNLQKGFEQCGVEALFVPLEPSPFNYKQAKLPLIPRWAQWCCYQRQKIKKKSPLIAKLFFPLFGFVRGLLFIWALFKYDVFIFGFCASFLRLKDLPILKFFNKTIICTFHGADARPPYLDGAVVIDENMTITECMKRAKFIKKRVMKIEKFATAVVNHLPYAHFHQKKFVSWLRIGIPFDFQDKKESQKTTCTEEGVRILHAPSSPGTKGTYRLREVIQSLKDKGLLINWIEISGQSHDVVKEEIARCDFIVDQLYSDTPMPGLVTEGAFFGKASVIGGYYSKQIHDNFEDSAIPPSLFCHPDDIEKAIEKMIVNAAFRKELGQKAKAFVNAHWSSKEVAKRFLRIIKGDIPEQWMCNPQELHYLQGAGLPEIKIKQFILQMLKQGGIGALQLTDKPSLEKAYIDFANFER